MRNWPYITAIAILALWGIIVPAWILFSSTERVIRTSFAAEQTELFEELANSAISNDRLSVDDAIQSIREYYPSGTKQITGTHLDTIVERSRRQNIELLQYYAKSWQVKEKP